MTIIACPECAYEVSDKARACPNCGLPVSRVGEIMATGIALETVQETSKKLKLQLIISSIFMVIGIAVSAPDVEANKALMQGALIVIGGFISFFIINKVFSIKLVVAVGVMILGITLINEANYAGDEPSEKIIIGSIVFVIGLIWYLLTKINIWWHHK